MRRETLTQLKGTRLEALFSGRWENVLLRDAKKRIFLDVSPSCFKKIVDFLNLLKIADPKDPPASAASGHPRACICILLLVAVADATHASRFWEICTPLALTMALLFDYLHGAQYLHLQISQGHSNTTYSTSYTGNRLCLACEMFIRRIEGRTRAIICMFFIIERADGPGWHQCHMHHIA